VSFGSFHPAGKYLHVTLKRKDELPSNIGHKKKYGANG
jgi:hypothetical protein